MADASTDLPEAILLLAPLRQFPARPVGDDVATFPERCESCERQTAAQNAFLVLIRVREMAGAGRSGVLCRDCLALARAWQGLLTPGEAVGVLRRLINELRDAREGTRG